MLIKKIVLVTVTLVLSLSLPSAFAANVSKNKWYIGVDAQRNQLILDSDMELVQVNGSNIRDALSGYSILGGYRWDCLGAEIGATYLTKVIYNGVISSGGRTITVASLTEKNYNFYVDGAYYYPLFQNVDIKGILGIGYLNTKFSGNAIISNSGAIGFGSGTERYQQLGFRAGVGLQYYFSDGISTSFSYKYQTGNDIYKGMNTYALGIYYHF